ncbi:MAG: hypothetical protein K8S15_09795 [Candidatus Aegiribacteria sp.]|nr:hypothetical protein [Candidatus Aegiribacteria sp.]
MLRIILASIFFALLFSSCYYGAMQGAHTLGKDHITVTGGVTLPAYFSAESKREAEDNRIDYLETYPTADFAIGATDRIDLGVSSFGYGVGPMVKYNFMNPHDATAVSAMVNMNYVIPVQVMLPRLSLCAGHRFDRDLEVFVGSDIGYGPDLANIPESQDGSHDWDSVDNTCFSCIRLGCKYELKPPGSPNENRTYIPESILFQFSIPLDISRSMILAGLAITY